MISRKKTDCPLCFVEGEAVLWTCDFYRIIVVNEISSIVYLRLIWNDHQQEMLDLSQKERLIVFQTLMIIESVIQRVVNPDKINLVMLGNVVPHLHWHIMGRFKQDDYFPNSIWGEKLRLSNTVLDPSWIDQIKEELNISLIRMQKKE